MIRDVIRGVLRRGVLRVVLWVTLGYKQIRVGYDAMRVVAC